jgi:two-component system, response regulator
MIFIVEDNADDEQLTLRALRQTLPNVGTSCARDGQEALDMLSRLDESELPLFVFLDLKLPKVDGFGVLKAVRQEVMTRYLPVVVLTSSAQDCDIQQAYEMGANCYVQKPVQFKQFIDAVSCAASFWASHNRRPFPSR